VDVRRRNIAFFMMFVLPKVALAFVPVGGNVTQGRGEGTGGGKMVFCGERATRRSLLLCARKMESGLGRGF